MKEVKWVIGVSALLLILTVAISACGGGSSAPDSAPQTKSEVPAGQKIFRMNAGKYSTLDPQICNDVGCAMYVDEIYSGLVTLTLVPKAEHAKYVEERGLPMLSGETFAHMPSLWREWANTYLKQNDSMDIVIAPDIAKEIPEPVYNNDGTVSYTFQLREDVYFHNGKHVTANDFKFSFERAASPNWPDRSSAFTLPTADLYLSDILCVREVMFGEKNEVCGVEVLGDYALRITIDSPKSYFLWKLTYPTAFVIDKDKIIDPTTGEVQKEDWTDPPNGTGPFKAIPGNEQTRLIANEKFYLGRPFLDEVILNHQGGQSTIFAYDAGDVDIAGVGIDYLPRVVEGSSSYSPDFAKQYRSGPSLDVFYVVLNTEKPPFDDPKVRRAFAMAVNKDDLELIGEGLFIPARGIVPPGINAYNPDFKGVSFDPEGAKQLLQESRYWGTDELKNVELLRSGSGPQAGPVTEAILDMWKKHIGISVIIDEPATGQVYYNRMNGGDYQIAVSGWIADYPDAEDFLDLKLYCNRIKDPITGRERCERDYANNQARYHNPEFDQLIKEARTERDPKRRIELYRRAEGIAVSDAPWIPLVHTKSSIAVKPYVSGYYPSPLAIPQFRFIDIKR
ncbi:MAG: peptide ABC transporter substrate-binding protein [Candidatus Spechtbacterales bacterium]